VHELKISIEEKREKSIQFAEKKEVLKE